MAADLDSTALTDFAGTYEAALHASMHAFVKKGIYGLRHFLPRTPSSSVVAAAYHRHPVRILSIGSLMPIYGMAAYHHHKHFTAFPVGHNRCISESAVNRSGHSGSFDQDKLLTP